MDPIFLVIGPPAVGKSTTSRGLASRFAKGLHIPVDDLRNMVAAGLVLPGANWSDDLTQQITLARESAVHMALAYHSAGFAVAIDDFWGPNFKSDYQPLFDHPQVRKIVLLPDQDKAHQRNLQRSGESPARAYIDDGIRTVYSFLIPALPQLSQEGWVILDTTDLSLEQTVNAILEMGQSA